MVLKKDKNKIPANSGDRIEKKIKIIDPKIKLKIN